MKEPRNAGLSRGIRRHHSNRPQPRGNRLGPRALLVWGDGMRPGFMRLEPFAHLRLYKNAHS